jgi:hypothetical protein
MKNWASKGCGTPAEEGKKGTVGHVRSDDLSSILKKVTWTGTWNDGQLISYHGFRTFFYVDRDME